MKLTSGTPRHRGHHKHGLMRCSHVLVYPYALSCNIDPIVAFIVVRIVAMDINDDRAAFYIAALIERGYRRV